MAHSSLLWASSKAIRSFRNLGGRSSCQHTLTHTNYFKLHNFFLKVTADRENKLIAQLQPLMSRCVRTASPTLAGKNMEQLFTIVVIWTPLFGLYIKLWRCAPWPDLGTLNGKNMLRLGSCFGAFPLASEEPHFCWSNLHSSRTTGTEENLGPLDGHPPRFRLKSVVVLNELNVEFQS